LGSIRFLNPRAQALTGWSPVEALDRVIDEVGTLTVVGGPELECPLRESMRTATAMDKRRCILRARTGREIPVEASATPIVASGNVVGAVAVLRDISQKLSYDAAKNEHGNGAGQQVQPADDSLERTGEESRTIAQRLLAMQEAERRRIARELHDDLSQRLATVGMETSILLRHITDPPDRLSDRIRDLAKRIGELAEELHGFSRQIHPAILNDLGLASALEEECRSLSRRISIPVHFEAENVPRSLPEDVALCMFRVAQEALRNIGKHANAAKVRVRLARRPRALNLSIEDAGGGFDSNASRRGGLGLISMRERVQLLDGEFAILSNPGEGTRVEVTVPLLEEAC
jgi:PAS domain S-box-containing protein